MYLENCASRFLCLNCCLFSICYLSPPHSPRFGQLYAGGACTLVWLEGLRLTFSPRSLIKIQNPKSKSHPKVLLSVNNLRGGTSMILSSTNATLPNCRPRTRHCKNAHQGPGLISGHQGACSPGIRTRVRRLSGTKL